MTRTQMERYAVGWAPPKLVKYTKKNGSMFDSFCSLSEPALQLPPLPAGYIYTDESPMILRGKNVEPHRDDQVGRIPKGYEHCGGAFGLLAGAGAITLQAGDDDIRLVHGDWVIFDDSLLHGVYAEKLWYGIAVQIARKK